MTEGKSKKSGKNKPKAQRLRRYPLKGFDPIEVKITVKPEMRVYRSKQGDMIRSLEFMAESGGDMMGELLAGERVYYIGETKGEAWEATLRDWRAQYEYVRDSVKRAAMILATMVSSEAPFAVSSDVDWTGFFEKVRKRLYSLQADFRKEYPPTDGGIVSFEESLFTEALLLVGGHLIFMETRFTDPEGRGGPPTDGRNPIIEAYIDDTIERMAISQVDTATIKTWRRGWFDELFPYGGGRTNMYNYVPSDRTPELRARYLARCRELRKC